MSEAVTHAAARHADAGHHEVSFVRHYIFSTDHKMIGKQFLSMGLAMLVLGGLLALLVRWELAWPANSPAECQGLSLTESCSRPVPLLGLFASEGSSLVSKAPDSNAAYILPSGYNAFFTMHATIMIFFAVMPILVGCFGNFLIPLMIGARDMAFPLLNMVSFWAAVPAGVMMLGSFFVAGGPAAAGWTSYVPLAADAQWTGVYWGQNLWCLSLIVLGASSLMGSVNYITTIINMRAPGMTWFRLPLTIWALFITAILLLLALPELTSALGMMLFDRMAGTHFFNPAGGGEPLLWQHLFWFFGHPEVYILILPAMGIASDVLSVFSRKPIFGYHAMAFSMIGIAGLSWIVWGHHMFQSGMSPWLSDAFMMTTMVIAVPSAIKTFNWLGTLWGGNIRFTTPMLFALAFVSMFVIGGLSGIFMASTPVDIFIHDTYFIVAHIHYVVFGGSMMGIFAGIYFWFPKMFGRMMNEPLGKVHWLLTLVFFNLTFFPMHIIGVGGHMRRIYDPTQYEFLKPLQHWNVLMTWGALLLGASQIIVVINFFWSMFAGKVSGKNPWQANTLEWEAPSPPPHGNFPGPLPTVYRGPYEYSSPLVAEDYLPQARRLEPQTAGARAH
jgi:cytochrome c oxidase subunit 1